MNFWRSMIPTVMLNCSLLNLRKSPQYLRLCYASSAFPTIGREIPYQFEDLVRPKRTRRPKTVYKLHEDLKSYFVSPEQKLLLDLFPDKLKRKKQKGPEHLYLSDPATASTVAKHILTDYNGNIPIVEVNPGPGLLTKVLIKRNIVKDLRLFEVHREFLPALEVYPMPFIA